MGRSARGCLSLANSSAGPWISMRSMVEIFAAASRCGPTFSKCIRTASALA